MAVLGLVSCPQVAMSVSAGPKCVTAACPGPDAAMGACPEGVVAAWPSPEVSQQHGLGLKCQSSMA